MVSLILAERKKKTKGDVIIMPKSVVAMKQLLESGVHFGHQTRRWNPKMAPYIYTKRNGIHIIDLQKTSSMIDEAYDYVRELSQNNGNLLFVGTKKQAKDSVREEAIKCGSPYVDSRWLGGTLTNMNTIRKRILRLEQIEKMEADGTLSFMTKKEASKVLLEKEKLLTKFGGIRNMKTLPSAMFIVDPKAEEIAVKEARALNVPIIAMCDTNCDPTVIDYVIPANDDAVRAVRLICCTMANAIIEGHEGKISDADDISDVESEFMDSQIPAELNPKNYDK